MKQMSSFARAVGFVAVAALAACGKEKPPEQPPTPIGTTTISGAQAACPCAENVGDGGTTMMRGPMGGPRGGMGAMRGMRAGPGMGAMVPADTRTEDVDGGVRMTFIARDAKDVAALREHARKMVEHMNAGDCPMM